MATYLDVYLEDGEAREDARLLRQLLEKSDRVLDVIDFVEALGPVECAGAAQLMEKVLAALSSEY